MEKLRIGLFAFLFLTGCASTGDVSSDAADEPKFSPEEKAVMSDKEMLAIYNANKAEEDKLSCTYEKLTGSRLKKKVCLTRKEREELRVTAQEELKRKQSGFNCDGAGACQSGGL